VKRNAIIGGAAAIAVAGIAIWYFALRDTRTSCEKLVGPVEDLEKLLGIELEMRSGYETKYSCYQYVDRAGRAGGYIVNLETNRGNVQSALAKHGARTFADKATFTTALGEATLFIAGDAKAPSSEELLADAQSHVGRASDPMGAALSKLPPSQHVALLAMGATVLEVAMDRETFTVDKAKAFVSAVAARAK
jgi:hypothetical protein